MARFWFPLPAGAIPFFIRFILRIPFALGLWTDPTFLAWDRGAWHKFWVVGSGTVANTEMDLATSPGLMWAAMLGQEWRFVVVGRRMLQFASSIMVPFSFPSYVILIYSLVCVHTIGYIHWFSWVLWTHLLSNYNPRRSRFTITGRDDTSWLICAYAYHGQPHLLSDSFVSDMYFLLLIKFLLVLWSSTLTRSLV